MEISPVFSGDAGIAVFLACDEKFIPCTITTIASIMENANPDDKYDIVVLTSGAITRDTIDTALAWFTKYQKGSLRFFDGEQELERAGREKFYSTKHYPATIYFRFFAPSLFKLYKRIIYLDSDMIVFADIAELYRADLGTGALGACHDILCETDFREKQDTQDAYFKKTVLGLEPDDGYFNSGMILFDLDRMRELRIQDRLLDALERIGDSNLPDQDILNSVCKNHVHYLNGMWNVHGWTIDSQTSTTFHYAGEAARKACIPLRRSCKVLHFTERKPWHYQYVGSLDGYYWYYSALTPFHESMLAQWRKENSLSNSIMHIITLLFYIARCGGMCLVGSPVKKAKNGRRLFEYKLRLKSQFRRIFCRNPPSGAPSLTD